MTEETKTESESTTDTTETGDNTRHTHVVENVTTTQYQNAAGKQITKTVRKIDYT